MKQNKSYVFFLLFIISMTFSGCLANSGLIKASQEGDVFQAETSIAQGAGVNGSDRYGNTALHYAVVNNHSNIIVLLVEYGADLNETNQEGNTPLHLLIETPKMDEKQRISLSEYFLRKRANINLKNKQNKSSLQLALERKNWPLIKTFFSYETNLDLDFTLSTPFDSELSPLSFALLENQDDMAALLLPLTSNIDQTSNSGLTALHIAIISGKPDYVQLLLEKGADIKLKTKEGWTCLDLALQSEKFSSAQKYNLTQLFLGLNLNPNNMDNQDIPSLYWALRFADDKTLDLLLSQGATLKPAYFNLSNPKNILTLVLERKKTGLLENFINNLKPEPSNYKEFSDLILFLAKSGNLNLLKKIAEKGLPLDQITSFGNLNALHVAVIQKNFPLMNYLLANFNFNLSQAINDGAFPGFSPLHLAIIQQDINAVNLLLAKKADPTQIILSGPYQGKTPQQMAELTKNKNMILLLNKKLKEYSASKAREIK